MNATNVDFSMVSIRDTELPSRVKFALNLNGIYTIGGLALRSEEELRALTNIGAKTISTLKSLLWDKGLMLRRHDETAFEKAQDLYTDIEEVPAYVLIATLSIHRTTAWRLQRLYGQETIGEIADAGMEEFQKSILQSNGNDSGRALRVAVESAVAFLTPHDLEFDK